VLPYILGNWEKYGHLPLGVLAHSTHVRGDGDYDAAIGTELPRAKVTLATRIPPGVRGPEPRLPRPRQHRPRRVARPGGRRHSPGAESRGDPLPRQGGLNDGGTRARDAGGNPR